jgi:23S rRNA pseudouridine1911/1915/1917 synthase
VSAAQASQTTYAVDDDSAGERLDRWLAAQRGAGTRSQIARAIAEGLVLVDNRAGKAGQRLRGGETVVVRGRAGAGSSTLVPEPIALDILHADDDVIAVNKPAGMVVHPAVGNRTGTLVHALLHRYPRASWPGDAERAGIVHRLDRDTSGVILVARTVARSRRTRRWPGSFASARSRRSTSRSSTGALLVRAR